MKKQPQIHFFCKTLFLSDFSGVKLLVYGFFMEMKSETNVPAHVECVYNKYTKIFICIFVLFVLFVFIIIYLYFLLYVFLAYFFDRGLRVILPPVLFATVSGSPDGK